MEKPSSTSSSELASLPHGFPWAFVGTLLILAAVEAIFHALPPAKVIPYRNGIEERYAIANYLRATRAADIAFVGSSMTRVGIAAPQVRARLEQAVGRRLVVANYGASGIVADEAAAILRYMIRRDAVPKLLMVEASPRHFKAMADPQLDQRSIFWSLWDWPAACARYGRLALSVLPNVIRNEISDWYLTLRYRKKIRFLAQEILIGTEQSPAPMNGDIPRSRTLNPNASIADPRRRQKMMQSWLRQNLPDGTFPLDQRMIDEFEELLRLCRQRQIPVIVYEVPYSNAIRQALPASTYPQFYAAVKGMAERNAVRFVTLEELGLELTDADFSEVSHLNHQGAGKFTRAIVEKALLPTILKALAAR